MNARGTEPSNRVGLEPKGTHRIYSWEDVRLEPAYPLPDGGRKHITSRSQIVIDLEDLTRHYVYAFTPCIKNRFVLG